MKVTQDSVKQWLKDHGRSRQWLADECESALQTINNWLGTDRGIPAKAVLIIERLMEADEAKAADEAGIPQNLVLEFSKESFSQICDVALSEGKKPRDWAEEELLKLAGMDMEELAKKLHPNVTPMVPRKKAHIMAAAGTSIGAEVLDWNGAHDTVSVQIVGDSMNPLFEDGQIVDFRHKKTARSPYMKKGLIYLVHYNDGYMVKKYNTRRPKDSEKDAEYLTGSGTVGVLESLNPGFKPIDITGPFEWDAWYDEK